MACLYLKTWSWSSGRKIESYSSSGTLYLPAQSPKPVRFQSGVVVRFFRMYVDKGVFILAWVGGLRRRRVKFWGRVRRRVQVRVRRERKQTVEDSAKNCIICISLQTMTMFPFCRQEGQIFFDTGALKVSSKTNRINMCPQGITAVSPVMNSSAVIGHMSCLSCASSSSCVAMWTPIVGRLLFAVENFLYVLATMAAEEAVAVAAAVADAEGEYMVYTPDASMK